MKGQIMTNRKTTVLGVHPAQPVATGHRIPSWRVRGSQTKTALTGQMRGPEQTTKMAGATCPLTPSITVGLRTTAAEKQKKGKQSNT